MDQSDAGSVGIFPHWTNQTQEAWVYSHDGPIKRTLSCGLLLPLPGGNSRNSSRDGEFVLLQVGQVLLRRRLRRRFLGRSPAACTRGR
eukprot:1572307-Pyramimonas_sp.AAC.1